VDVREPTEDERRQATGLWLERWGFRRVVSRGRLHEPMGDDNTNALRFYQRRGMRLAGLHRDAIAGSRRLKPEIPETGADGIPIRDELELELVL
jgi:hypothetical protein